MKILLCKVVKKGLRTYLDRTQDEREEEDQGALFRTFDKPLNTILDDCLAGAHHC
jgi:hypothetical protein